MPSNITVSNLVITPGLGQTFFSWEYDDPNSPDGVSYLQLDRVELHWSTVNDRSTASKIAEAFVSGYHVTASGANFFYWIRARDKSGQYGDWYPASPTGGIEAGATGSLGTNGWWKLPPGIIFQWGRATVTDHATITFPHTFPNAVLGIVASCMNSAGGASAFFNAYIDVDSVTMSQFDLYARKQSDGLTTAPAIDTNWIALGY